MRYIKFLLFGNGRSKIDISYANDGAFETTTVEYAINDTFDTGDWNCKTDVIALAGVGSIDTNYFTCSIEEWPARITTVNCGIRLDHIGKCFILCS